MRLLLVLLVLGAACDSPAPAPLFQACTISPGCEDPRAICHPFAQGERVGHVCSLQCASDLECTETGVPSECVGVRANGVLDPVADEGICVRVCPAEGCDDGTVRACGPIEGDPAHRRLCFTL